MEEKSNGLVVVVVVVLDPELPDDVVVEPDDELELPDDVVVEPDDELLLPEEPDEVGRGVV